MKAQNETKKTPPPLNSLAPRAFFEHSSSIITSQAAQTLKLAFKRISENHLPSHHSVFPLLRRLSSEKALSPGRLGQFYLAYQSAMHATRVMVYFLPHLDAPHFRALKVQILKDDDGLLGGDTHHFQLTRLFKNLGAKFPIEENQFGELSNLKSRVTPGIAVFISTVQRLYPQSLGAWTIVELLSSDWMSSLASSLSAGFPSVTKEPYFHDCFSMGIEDRHGEQALELAQKVVAERPELLHIFIQDAEEMAQHLSLLWLELKTILLSGPSAH